MGDWNWGRSRSVTSDAPDAELRWLLETGARRSGLRSSRTKSWVSHSVVDGETVTEVASGNSLAVVREEAQNAEVDEGERRSVEDKKGGGSDDYETRTQDSQA